MLKQDGVVMMKVLVAMVMMMMMISMKPSSMTVMMAMIFPLQEGISPTDFYLRRAFSLCVFFASQRQRSLFVIPLVLGFRGDDICEGALAEVGQGGHTT
jgi:hypothetical protein